MKELTQLDIRFQEALQQLTGEVPPTDFYFNPLPEDRDEQNSRQQNWAVLNVKPTWACGITLVDTARQYVVDAIGNSNLYQDGGVKESFMPEEVYRATGRTTRMWLSVVSAASELAAGNSARNVIQVVVRNRWMTDVLKRVVEATGGEYTSTNYGARVQWPKGNNVEVHISTSHCHLRGVKGNVFVSHDYLERLKDTDYVQHQSLVSALASGVYR